MSRIGPRASDDLTDGAARCGEMDVVMAFAPPASDSWILDRPCEDSRMTGPYDCEGAACVFGPIGEGEGVDSDLAEDSDDEFDPDLIPRLSRVFADNGLDCAPPCKAIAAVAGCELVERPRWSGLPLEWRLPLDGAVCVLRRFGGGEGDDSDLAEDRGDKLE